MGVFDIFSYSKAEVSNTEKPQATETAAVGAANTGTQGGSQPTAATKKVRVVSVPTSVAPSPSVSTVGQDAALVEPPIHAPARRFSFRRPFGFSSKTTSDDKPILSATHEHQRRVQAGEDLEKRVQKVQASKSDKRAQQSALAVRALIVGPTSSVPIVTATTAKPQLNALKSQLLEPKVANRVIAHLRTLPAHDGAAPEGDHPSVGPIHAVCLEHTDEEEHQLHFAKLTKEDTPREISTRNVRLAAVSFAPLDEITRMFNEMHIVDLLGSPDFGLGQPGNGKGILSGAVPTAETVIEGFKQITPELMALGYATGKAITPDHSRMHPPTDRMSIMTYWWGFELLLPPPSLKYLTRAHSVSGALMNFLSAVALVNNGVREILPFIRYISQFVDFEFNSIKAKDEGRGVVCAATWIMPAALVPRPWDFPPPPDTPLTTPDGTVRRQPDTLPERIALSLPSTSEPIPSSILEVVATKSVSPALVKSRGILLTARA